MSKVTSKLQVTIPKALADRMHVRPGDEIEWLDAGGGLLIVLKGGAEPLTDKEQRLQLLREAALRQAAREKTRKLEKDPKGRGWTREELYDRGRAR